jgi:hypothetical protein
MISSLMPEEIARNKIQRQQSYYVHFRYYP